MILNNLNFKKVYKENKYFILFGVALCLLYTINLWLFTSENGALQHTVTEPADITTYIPKGFRLVPIEVENYKNLDQILGQYGVVDIYIKKLNGTKFTTQLFGSGVRAIRPKNNSKSIGLLLPKEQVKNLLRLDGKFILTLNNQKQTGTNFEVPVKSARKSRIIFTN